MSIKINKKIVGYTVNKSEDVSAAAVPTVPAATPALPEDSAAAVVQMDERVERPERLEGSTYKIKSPLFEHALYVTINDIVLNEGTEHESRSPFEIFINSKNMEHFQWAVALTRIMSAVFRKGGDVTFLVEELKAVFDPRGGYYKSGGVYMPSIVAELGFVIEDHLQQIGMLAGDELSAEQRAALASKRAQFEARTSTGGTTAVATPGKPVLVVSTEPAAVEAPAFPPSANMCGKCSTKAVVLMDGCHTCLNCGYSKCG